LDVASEGTAHHLEKIDRGLRTFTGRPLAPDDRERWLALWQGYLAFYKTELPASVTNLTRNRLLEPEAPIRGLCAAAPDGRILGVVH
jgi:hypothetical protein